VYMLTRPGDLHRFGIGTAQFGMDYGISNLNGKTSPEEVKHILELAARMGFRVIDTAPLYGDSEKVLGATMPEGHQFRIVTKTPQFKSNAVSNKAESLRNTFRMSLHKLKLTSAYGLLIHDPGDLFAGDGRSLFEAMETLREEGLVEKIGVSVYTENEINMILDNFKIDLIQVPLNVLDQRLLHSGQLARLKRSGIEIHARSVFLQGLLLMSPGQLDGHFEWVRDQLVRYNRFLELHNLSRLEGALSFVTGLKEIDCIILGVSVPRDLLEIGSFLSGYDHVNLDFSQFSCDKKEIINPSLWIRTECKV
ncbi:MAG: aldo/keto reductase, partial [candidate division Zixibacteria bacterium]|nr:aldo/keto reductase [candidate division Zixibacteria bacterium]